MHFSVKRWFLPEPGHRLRRALLTGGALLLTAPAWAQTTIPPSAPLTGRVVEADGARAVLPGASVFWLGTKLGTAADASGKFSLAYPPTPPPWRLVVRFLGLRPDTLRLSASAAGPVTIGLRAPTALGEAQIVGQREAHSATSVGQLETISTRDLTKSACCNLAESFETNAAVEVSTTDAVSGAKQIQLLGLDGAYSLLTVDNQPALRGLATPYRLNYLAGPWIEAIDIIKGTGSVVNGYEGISGQVNVRLKEPDKTERLHLNIYGNDLGKTDYNVVAATPLTNRTSAEVLIHADHLSHRADRNDDGFLDLPLATQFNGMAKWKYKDGTRWMVELGGGALRETRRAGQVTFGRSENPFTSTAYGVTSVTDRLTGFGRASYTFAERPYQTIGVLANVTGHEVASVYGRRPYDGRQTTVQATALMQGIFGTTAHVWKTGVSFLHDDVSETLNDRRPRARRERVPGGFAEYTYQDSRRLTAVAGLRFDQHNLYGSVWTPRLSLKYDFTPETVLRLSGGTGFRVANPVAENSYALTSSRAIIFLDSTLQPERARNLGGSLTRYFAWHGRAGAVILDYYHTAFSQQVVADMYADPTAITFSNLRSSANLRGRSVAQSAQIEAHYEVLKGLQVKGAWKWYDVRGTYPGGYELPRALLPRYRAFLNLAYASAFDKWRFDLTAQWYGQRPLPGINHAHHAPTTEPASAPPMRTTPRFALLNAQATRAFKQLELYVGVENLLNYRQPEAIVGASAPFSPGFDAGMVWGPVFGRLTYAGLRYTLR